MKQRKPYTTYTKEFKQEAVRLMETSDRPAAEIAMELGEIMGSGGDLGVGDHGVRLLGKQIMGSDSLKYVRSNEMEN